MPSPRIERAYAPDIERCARALLVLLTKKETALMDQIRAADEEAPLHVPSSGTPRTPLYTASDPERDRDLVARHGRQRPAPPAGGPDGSP